MLKLKDIDTAPPKDANKEEAKKQLKKLAERLELQQELLYANKKYSLLIILQGVDAAGKDGTIKQVFSSINPQGCNVKSFGVPSADEAAHEFMWRAYQQFPAKGMIQIFNRSYYEAILVTTVEKLSSPAKNKSRMRFINHLEEYLEESNTIILKFYLHVSAEEQMARIERRLSNERKKWKYDPSDVRDAGKRDKYLAVYEKVFTECNVVPWIIVPADAKWYRNLVVAETIVETLESLKLKFPGHSTQQPDSGQ